MFDAIATVLAWFYSLCGSYGGAIMLLTLAIMLLLTPLTLKGTRSMLAMQRLQPELRKLQTKYKDDREKLNQELMAFYKENNINPVGGCLPLLIQMPVFIVLYRVLFGLTRRHRYGRDLGASFTDVFTGGSGSYAEFGNFDPDHLDRGTQLFKDLSQTNRMGSFGMDLAESAQQVLTSGGLVKALPYIVLVLVVAATSYVQQKQVSARTPQGQSPMNSQQQMLLKIMPLIFVFFSFTLPAGIVLYFVVSNLYRVGQQAFITRTMYAGSSGSVIDTTATEVSPPGGGGFKGFLESIRPPSRATDGRGGSGKGSAGTGSARGTGGAKPGSKAAGKPGGRAGSTGGKARAGDRRSTPAGSANGAKNASRRAGQAPKGNGAGPVKGGAGSSKSPAGRSRAVGDRSSATPTPAPSPKGSTPHGAPAPRAPSRNQPPAPPRPSPRKKRK